MKTAVLVLCGVLGGVAGGLFVQWAVGEERPGRARVAERGADAGTVAELRALARRVEALERAAARPGPVGTPGGGPDDAAEPARGEAPPDSGTGPAGAGDAPVADGGPEGAAVAEWLPALLEGRFDGDKVGEMFGRLARRPEAIPAVLGRIEAAIARDPDNPDLRTALGTALVAKLQNATPPGIQQGMVWAQADAAYRKAIELEPDHWTARYSRAVGTTFIPPQFGRQPDAIRQFEELVALQEQRAPQDGYADSYFQLGRLYSQSGNVEKAREVWRRGLALHPDDEQLSEMLEVSSKR